MKNNASRDFWTNEKHIQLRTLASSGMAASEIAAAIGATKLSVLQCCSRRGISVVMHTAAELAATRAINRAREKRKLARRRAAQTTAAATLSIKVRIGTSRTHPIYRNQLPRLPDGTSREALRRMISEAVRNTAEMQT